jgi:NAD-dependent protein deacetylases, SIR2 family
MNTVLPTGPGCWEKKAQGKASNKPTIKTEMIKAVPTPTHMALVKLMEVGRLKYLISQNVDFFQFSEF